LVGKRAQAEQISKWLGSLGKHGRPPDCFFVAKAAEILGCSYLDLFYHADRFELMRTAFTLNWGRSDGEYLRELNPEYIKKRKHAESKIATAQKQAK
jgi:hypothetical protein